MNYEDYKKFGYGYIAGISGIVVSHPFDTIKTNIQKKQMIHYNIKNLYKGVAAPLFGEGGKLQGVLCIVGPEFRLTQEIIQRQILNPLLDTCGIISSKMGWYSSQVPRTLV